MIIGRDKEGFLIRLTEKEVEEFENRKRLTRPVAWSKGYFRMDLKLTKVKDPFGEEKER